MKVCLTIDSSFLFIRHLCRKLLYHRGKEKKETPPTTSATDSRRKKNSRFN